MVTPKAIITLLLLAIFVWGDAIAQEQAYVSDSLVVNFRTGKGNQYRIAQLLSSGTQMTVLERTEDDWANVRLSDGTEGWVRTQYIQPEPIARDLLIEARERIGRLLEENQSLTNQKQALEQDHQVLTEQNEVNTVTIRRLEQELARITELSANAIKVTAEYQALQTSHEQLRLTYEEVLAEKDILENNQRLNFMLYGAGLVLLGILLAIVLPKLRPKKRFAEWD